MAYPKQHWVNGDVITSAKLNHMEDGIAQGADALDAIAKDFDPEKEDGYKIGDYCIYGGTLYRFINAHTGAWNASDVDAVDVGDELIRLNTAIAHSAPLYGALWDRTTNLMTRTRDASGITTTTTNFCHKGSINENYDNPFDKIYPWSDMVVCDVDLTKYRSGNYSLKDCISAVYGDADFTYYGSDTNFVGRYRPEFWYKSEEVDGKVEFLVSPVERDGFAHAEEAIDGISFVVDDGSGNSTVTSGANVPLTNVAVSTIHTRAKNSGFTLQDIFSIDAQIVLYLVEYANMNSQNAIGDGCSSCYRQNESDVIANVGTSDGKTTFTVPFVSALNALLETGVQLSFGTSSGATTYKANLLSATNDGTNITCTLDRTIAITNGMYLSVHGFMSCEFPLLGESIGNASGYLGTATHGNAFYRGALMYANRYSYILGIYRQQNTNHLWICDNADPNNYDALNTSVHTDTGVALPDVTAGWLTVGGNAQRIRGLMGFMATGTSSGSSSSPVGDQQYVPAISAGDTILLFGCNSNIGWSCGLFSGNWSHGAGYSNWSNGGLPLLKKSL